MEKLRELLALAGVTHEDLNSKDLGLRRKARNILAQYYGGQLVILENERGDKVPTTTIDGQTVTRGTFSSLTARTFADSAHGAIAWKFVTFKDVAKVIPIIPKNAPTKEGIIKTVSVKLGEKDTPFTAEQTRELRSMEEIKDDEDTQNAIEADASGQTSIPLPTIEEEKAPKRKKSV